MTYACSNISPLLLPGGDKVTNVSFPGFSEEKD